MKNLNFKTESMPNFIIQTHRKETIYKNPHLFVLNKGLNSGKPQKTEFTNSFVIIFSNDEDLETVYWIAYSLWKSKFWHQFLCGSVIPFLRINDLKHNFSARVKHFITRPRSTSKRYESVEVAGTKRKTISRKHKLNQRFAKSDFTSLLQKINHLLT